MDVKCSECRKRKTRNKIPELNGGKPCKGSAEETMSCSDDEYCHADKVCKWFGTAVFCEAWCPGGWEYQRKSKRGDGKKCWTGEKYYCCKTRWG